MNTVTTSLHQTLPLQLTPTNTWQTVDLGYVSRSTSLFRGSNLLKPAVADAEADTISTRM